jgi:hypothetical protein
MSPRRKHCIDEGAYLESSLVLVLLVHPDGPPVRSTVEAIGLASRLSIRVGRLDYGHEKLFYSVFLAFVDGQP